MSKINMNLLKESVMQYKDKISKIDEEAKVIGEKFQKEQKKRDAITDKESAQYELQAGITEGILKELRQKNEERNDLEEKIKNTISNIKDTLEADKEKLAKKALEGQKSIQNLEKEQKYFEDLNDKDKAHDWIKEDDQIVQNRNKKIAEIKAKIETLQSDISNSIEEINEINNKLQYIDYDNIEKYQEEKETDQKDSKNNEQTIENEQTPTEQTPVKQTQREQTQTEDNKSIENKQNVEKIGKQILDDMSRDYKNIHYDVEPMPESNINVANENNTNKQFSEREPEKLYKDNEEIPPEQLEGLERIGEDKPTINNINEKQEQDEDKEKESRIKKFFSKIKEFFANIFNNIKNFAKGVKMLPKAMKEVSKQLEEDKDQKKNEKIELGKEKNKTQKVEEKGQDKDEMSLKEMLDNSKLSEREKIQIEFHAEMNGEESAKKKFAEKVKVENADGKIEKNAKQSMESDKKSDMDKKEEKTI